MRKKRAVAVWVKALYANKPLVICCDGSASREFLYQDDLCDGIMRVLETTVPKGGIFYFVSKRETTVKDLADLECRIAYRSCLANYPYL